MHAFVRRHVHVHVPTSGRCIARGTEGARPLRSAGLPLSHTGACRCPPSFTAAAPEPWLGTDTRCHTCALLVPPRPGG